MKTKTIVTVAALGIIGYMLWKKAAKPAGVGDDLLLPSDGRTVTAGGQVLNGEQVYDAAPYQYRRDPLNDLGLGWGGSIGRAVSRAASKTKKVVSKVTKPALKVAKVAAVVTTQGVATQLILNPKIITNPKEALRKGYKNIVQAPKKALASTVGLVFKPRAAAPAGTAVEYQDENGNVITKAEYDALMASYAAQNRADAAAKKTAQRDAALQKQINALLAQRLKIVNSIPVAQTSKNAKAIAQKKAQIAAIDKKIQALVNKLSPAVGSTVATNVQTSTNVQDTAVITQTGTTTATPTVTYTPEQAAAEEASITAASDDSGYGTTTTDYSSGSTSSGGSSYDVEAAAAEEASIRDPDQSPALPETVTSVETPSAQVLPEEAPAPAEKKSNTGLLVGGGILAAIAAGLAFK